MSRAQKRRQDSPQSWGSRQLSVSTLTGEGSDLGELLQPPEDHVGPSLDVVQVTDVDTVINAAVASQLCVVDLASTEVRSTLRVLRTLQPLREAPAVLLVAHSGSDILALGRDEALASETVVIDPEAGLPAGRKLLWLAMRRAVETRSLQDEAGYWERRYSNLWDRAIPGLYRMAADGRILSCNDTLVRMLGYDSKAALEGRQLHEVDAELAVEPRPLNRGISPRPYWRRDTCLVRADGTRLWCRMSDFPVPSQEVDPEYGAVFEGTVIGADWEFELSEQVRRNEALYLALFGAMSEGVLLMDEDGVVRACNQSAEELLGLPLREIQGQPIDRCVARVHLRSGEPVAVERLWRSDDQVFRLGLSNGGSCWAKVRTAPVLVPGDPEAVQYLVTLADRSDQVRSESEREKAELASRLAAGLSHDLRNYLTAICSSAALVRLQAGDQLADFVRDSAAQIELAGKHGAELLDRALRVARETSSGMASTVPAPAVALDEQIGSIELLIRGLMPRGIRLEVYLGAPGAEIAGPVVAIEQIVLNLVMNARQALGAGGTVELSTSLQAGAKGEPGVVLRVSDDGPGLSEDQARRIFDPFHSERDGIGLGLMMVRELVQSAGGEVSVSSQVGEGTSFSIWWPLV